MNFVNGVVTEFVDRFKSAAVACRMARTKQPRTARRPDTPRRVRAASARRDPRSPQIFETLRQNIAMQQIAPGTRLRETELAAQFGVPRPRIREVLAALEQRGLLERIPNRGAIVKRPDVAQLFCIYDLRAVLEGFSARLATERLPGHHWRAQLELFAGPVRTFLEEGDLDRYIEHYEHLRAEIIAAAGNPVLAEMLDGLYEKTRVLIWRIILLQGRAEVGRQQHVAMLEAMCRGDADEAERLRALSIRSAKAALEKFQRFII